MYGKRAGSFPGALRVDVRAGLAVLRQCAGRDGRHADIAVLQELPEAPGITTQNWALPSKSRSTFGNADLPVGAVAD
jgi:hypothetical protein